MTDDAVRRIASMVAEAVPADKVAAFDRFTHKIENKEKDE